MGLSGRVSLVLMPSYFTWRSRNNHFYIKYLAFRSRLTASSLRSSGSTHLNLPYGRSAPEAECHAVD